MREIISEGQILLQKIETVDQVQSLFGLNQHCKSLIPPLSTFGGVVAFVKEKFRDGIDIFVKGEICYILTNYANPTSKRVGFCL